MFINTFGLNATPQFLSPVCKMLCHIITAFVCKIYKKNYLKRGYDNVLEIAKELSLLLKAELNYNSLLKIKYTKPQYKMNYKQRQNNIKGSFIS